MQGLEYWPVNWQCQTRVGSWQAKSSTRWSHGQMMQTIILKQIPKSVNLRYFCPFVKMQSRSLIAYYKRISSLLFQFFNRSENESWLSKNLSGQSSCPATIWKLVWALSMKLITGYCYSINILHLDNFLKTVERTLSPVWGRCSSGLTQPSETV